MKAVIEGLQDGNGIRTCICRWKGELVPVNLLTDQPEMHRHYANAKLVGFTNSDGFRCSDTKHCTNHYAFDESGKLRLLNAQVRYEERKDISDGEIWEIVDEWKVDTFFVECEPLVR